MEDEKYLIYQIYNKVENKSYIGSTYELKQRIYRHKRSKNEWQIDFAVHPENWEVNVLEDNLSDKEAKFKEIYYIDLYDAIDNGYNKQRQGFSTSKTVKNKISHTLVGKFAGENHPNYGKHLSEEQRKRLSEVNKGKVVSEETRKKLSESCKGRIVSEETRKKISKVHKGKTPWNKGKKGVQTAWNKGKTGIFSEETLKRLSESHKNISEETRQKMRDAKKNYIPSNKGKIFIYNDTGNKCINPDDLQKYLDLGYKKGYKPKE